MAESTQRRRTAVLQARPRVPASPAARPRQREATRALRRALLATLLASACFVDDAENSASSASTGPETTTPKATSTATAASASASTSTTAGTTDATSTTADPPTTTADTAMTTDCVPQAWYVDADEDSFGDPEGALFACEAPPGSVANDLDCDDDAPTISPDADEVCDTIDNDCDELVDEWSPANQLCDGCAMRYAAPSVYHLCDGAYSFAAARALCQARGGDLVILAGADEATIVTDLLAVDGPKYWIGLSDRDTEGTFLWVDGNPLLPRQAQWNVGEPNNSGGDEDCVELRPTGQWNDVVCGGARAALCEVPPD